MNKKTSYIIVLIISIIFIVVGTTLALTYYTTNKLVGILGAVVLGVGVIALLGDIYLFAISLGDDTLQLQTSSPTITPETSKSTSNYSSTNNSNNSNSSNSAIEMSDINPQ